MQTTSVSNLKARLSEMLRTVKSGEELVVMEHRKPVAVIRSIIGEPMIVREATAPYTPTELKPLVATDPTATLDEERADRW